MAITQFESSERTIENEERQQVSPVFEESQKRSSTAVGLQITRRNPPARNTSRFWFERFLAVIQRQNPSLIDSSFLSQIAPSNEGKLLAQLKFLGVIDEQGKPTPVLPMLNMVGDEQKKAFNEIARDAYRDLENEVKMDRAVPDDVVNFFIRKYSFTRDKGINAAKFYLYLVEKGGGQVSGELNTFLAEKSSPLSLSNGTVQTSARISDRQPAKIQIKDSRVDGSLSPRRQNGTRKVRPSTMDYVEGTSPIQAIINIRLEKDTPKEYWDRVLALLGERQRAIPPQEAGAREPANQGLESDLTADSAFT
jgi:hypothetical protein